MSASRSQHVLRLVLSCRNITAHVTQPGIPTSSPWLPLPRKNSSSNTDPNSIISLAPANSGTPKSLPESTRNSASDQRISASATSPSMLMKRSQDLFTAVDWLRRVGVEIDGADRLREIGPR
ncbi:hypothetical protein REPUB_Repub20aG0033700 [Reevesia pubescens]